MPLKWTDWNSHKYRSPYVDWWHSINREGVDYDEQDEEDCDKLVLRKAPLKTSYFQVLSSTPNPVERLMQTQPQADAEYSFKEGPISRADFIETYANGDEIVPLPKCSENMKFSEYVKTNNWLPNFEDLPLVDDDTIIVGVIDSGVPLSHRRCRNMDGTTRILAAWQQNAVRDEETDAAQAYIPFGRELYKKDIDDLLEEHSFGGLLGQLDEDKFNTVAGLMDMRTVLGHRELAGRHSHGSHILDVAAGVEPIAENSEMMRRLKIIAVNFPSRFTFGLSGTFLDYFMIYGLQRILDVADAIWDKNHPNAKEGSPKGYPVVVNISFGKQAGSKDQHDLFPSTLADIKTKRSDENRAPFDVVMPVGNDNLLRCNAVLNLSAGKAQTVNWRILPEDQSSNYVEVWSEPFSNWSTLNAEQIDVQLELAVTPPGQETIEFSVGETNRSKDLAGISRIYYQTVLSSDKKACRFRFVICVAPTLRQTGSGNSAPAGVWKIHVRSVGQDDAEVYLSVQTDQSILPTSSTGLRSYFDEACYKRFSQQGRMLDSYNYPIKTEKVDMDGKCVVRRHGTINASASNIFVAPVSGYRRTDGQPAPYSATGIGKRTGCGSRGAPVASFPTDDGAAHFGILAAGARDGYAVAMRGTSFASAQATRLIAMDRMKYPFKEYSSGNARLFEFAQSAEYRNDTARKENVPPFYASHSDIEKIGAGRIESPIVYRVSRFDTWLK